MTPLKSLTILILSASIAYASIPADSMPFAPKEAAVIQRLIEREGTEVVVTTPGPRPNVIQMLTWLQDPTIDTADLKAWQIHNAANRAGHLSITYNPQGQIVALTGNGPWIHNDSLREFIHLPELRIIRVDHNSRHHREPERGQHYRGEGFEALKDSKVAIVGLTSGTNDDGLAAIRNLTNLKWFEIFHAPISDAGIEQHLSHHPTLKHLRIGKMGNTPASILKAVATIPRLEELRFQEAYVTYDNGLDHLKPLSGQLTLIDLTASIITQADLDRLKADHPTATIRSSTPEQVGNGHIGVARRLAREELPAELGAPLRAAIAAR